MSGPYYPPHVAIPHYEPNTTPLPKLLVQFGAIIAVPVLSLLAGARQRNPALKNSISAQLTFCWFALCGFLHLFFEGFYVVHHATLASSQAPFAQAWKEYALSDSRYLTSDPFMLCIETLTCLVWGPLCVWTAVSIVRTHGSKGFRGYDTRHLLQAVVCVGHLYGVALYYGTCHFEETMRGTSYSRPEWIYYWVYYVGFNAPWVIVPALLLRQSVKVIVHTFRVAEIASRDLE
ncbi:putative 3-beta-hydroxysteroid-Delta(8),Delta(7)-isomerase [Diplogelasinospora grovesii]|uniref:3-beta-hydroxysteroid-Delta(8),Delta(7)-isomerase n=1 Tax=Diplogelasinospora grovesii TaxID=303347 RepID=A0AAN6NDV1_9PEZI|nr:putative 3-beta-hydroxysteroid-Delta(8),Delta(7)-isomerase [Diplogelasinospora grovesii]